MQAVLQIAFLPGPLVLCFAIWTNRTELRRLSIAALIAQGSLLLLGSATNAGALEVLISAAQLSIGITIAYMAFRGDPS